MISAERLQSLIDAWLHEAAVARASLRADDYAARCQDTAEALRELQSRSLSIERNGPALLKPVALLCEAAQFMDACKECDAASWTEYDQGLRDRISELCKEVMPPAGELDTCRPTQSDLSMVITL